MKNIAILITHGTDTLAWTHAYVRYALKKNSINVAITGSQIPLPALPSFSDAYINIANSVHFLRNIKPSHVFTVFNYGSQAFSDSLYKVDRWNNHAFSGDMIARMEWDEVKFADRSIEIEDEPQKIDKLYLLTTGGTIAASYNDNSALAPDIAAASMLEHYIKEQLKDAVDTIVERKALIIDSSDLTMDKMKTIVDKVVECAHKDGYKETFADCCFDSNVRIIYTDPFKSIEDYKRESSGASAVILAGYGGGNINIEKSYYSPLKLIKELLGKDIPVVLTSQVALGPADFIYENARKAIEIGVISGVDLSLPEIQVRLSYLLGHKDEICKYAKLNKSTFLHVIESLFVSGMKFRTRKSQKMYCALKGFTPCEKDLLINKTFEEALASIDIAAHKL
ncbi:MAG: asparaginase domain-containing protein [Rikenellaceae bacterium]